MPTHSGSVEDHGTLMRFDPVRDFDRLMDQNLGGGTRTPRTMPLTATRRGDTFLVDLDVPGVRRDDVDLTVERNVVTVRATRSPERQEGDEVIIDERPYGQFERQLFLGDNLDPAGCGGPARRCAATDHPGERGEQAAPCPAGRWVLDRAVG